MSTAPSRWRRATAAVAAALALTAAGLTATGGPAHADADCLAIDTRITHWTTGPGTGGYQVTLIITNTCDTAITGWTLSLTLPSGHTIQQGWNASWTVAGNAVTVTPPPWSSALQPGGSLSVGFIGTWTGSPRPPICRINGRPCELPPGEEPAPQVTLTAPVERSGNPSVCALPMTAAVEPGTATVDRVEFYLNGQLVGADGNAPYGIEVPADHPAFNTINPYLHTAFARVVTTSSATADSPTTTFQRAVHPPALMAISCQPRVEVVEGGTATAVFVTACSGTPDLRLTVTGDAGISVPDLSTPGTREHRITVTAAPGSAGATARITATPEPTGCMPASTQVVVTPA
ncbi:cellulose binding domain-containing protein [Solwaraspora sp. WMMD1047]|uniref:cellulose binding domain-containing protein n=1 Tax=Solwaraspora sp. WMMD1047 TaxID=3016102 RepID=UPI002416FD01|nr:cellulose binding domain-containing protein [Solwaraspora sp. WMMD1047]MDG4828607.1 cellulose binding domain-containing protein [Solwaraspora sp. WMMD1047]